jgi:hypothetical protein
VDGGLAAGTQELRPRSRHAVIDAKQFVHRSPISDGSDLAGSGLQNSADNLTHVWVAIDD